MPRVGVRRVRGCNFEAATYDSQNSTYIDLEQSQYDNVSFIIDNSFYPCSGGYQSEVPLSHSDLPGPVAEPADREQHQLLLHLQGGYGHSKS